jgi:hypothetical protein
MLDEETSRKRIVKHLEFLGYTCEDQKDGWTFASHPHRWDFFFRLTPVGVLFHCTIRLGLLSEEKRLEFLEFYNRINASTLFCRFTLETTDPKDVFVVRIRTLAPGDYQRRQFGAFIDMWHKELERMREGPSLETGTDEEEQEQVSGERPVVN